MSQNKKRETAGKIASDLLIKQINDTHSAFEQTKENLTNYEKKLLECLAENKRKFIGDFYIEISVKKEKLLSNVIRNYFIGRLSCPTPNYDQVLYKYTRKNDHLGFLWVIPSRDTCFYLIQNALTLLPEERDLLLFVMEFSDGTLMKKAKALNKEKADSDLLIS